MTALIETPLCGWLSPEAAAEGPEPSPTGAAANAAGRAGHEDTPERPPALIRYREPTSGICHGGPHNRQTVDWTEDVIVVVVDGAGCPAEAGLLGRYVLAEVRLGVRQYRWRSPWGRSS